MNNPVLIFLVDDDKMSLVSLQQFLQDQFRFKVVLHLFTSGEECLKKIQDHPDLIILDYFLNADNPEVMDGLQIIKKIKDISENTAIIMLSAQNNMEIAASAVKYGAKEYIVKCDNAYEQIAVIVNEMILLTGPGPEKIQHEIDHTMDPYL